MLAPDFPFADPGRALAAMRAGAGARHLRFLAVESDPPPRRSRGCATPASSSRSGSPMTTDGFGSSSTVRWPRPSRSPCG
jgi:hypothetical protein